MPSIATLWKPRDCWMSWTSIWERVTNNTFVEISILIWKEILCEFFSGRADSIANCWMNLSKEVSLAQTTVNGQICSACFTIRYTIADMAIWPWIGWLVDGKIYGEAGEFLQVKDGFCRRWGWGERRKERLLPSDIFLPILQGFIPKHFNHTTSALCFNWLWRFRNELNAFDCNLLSFSWRGMIFNYSIYQPLFISDSEPVLTLLATLSNSPAVPGTSWTLWQSQESCNSRSTRTFAHGLHVLEHVPQCSLVKTRTLSILMVAFCQEGSFLIKSFSKA